MRVAGLAALTVAMLAGACVSAAAQDYEKVWDVGLDPGMIYPTGHRQFSATVPNNLDYSITGSESLSEEESEGFVLPPLNGSSSIGGSISPMPELAMHVYRRVSDSWSVGALFGWSGVHQGFVDSQGVYDQPGFTRLGFSSWFLHMAPVARFGASKGTVRPFAVFGPEISVINEHASGYYIDPDDSVPPEDLYDKTHIDLGAVVGAGCQVMLMPNGALGLSVEYHKVASFGPNMDYITPHITLDVYF